MSAAPDLSAGFSCPIPLSEYPVVSLAHGGGGTLSRQLVEKMFLPLFGEALNPLHDGAILPVDRGRIAFTTDSYVVRPLFFPGGDIGSLAIHGTVNDLAMCGAKPEFLSVSFVIEEGLPMNDLWTIVRSMQSAAQAAGVRIVTGDTKVVDRGKGDGIFINTSGVGVIPDGVDIDPRHARPGDVVILSGTIADHGMAIMSVREGLEFDTPIASDTAALNGLVKEMLSVCRDIHVLRDPTRGGVASALNEIAKTAGVGMRIVEEKIPVAEETASACELLGFDPLYVANEGKLIAIVPQTDADSVLMTMKKHPLGAKSAIIGEVAKDRPGTVTMTTRIGGSRVVDMLSGEQLPRIC